MIPVSVCWNENIWPMHYRVVSEFSNILTGILCHAHCPLLSFLCFRFAVKIKYIVCNNHRRCFCTCLEMANCENIDELTLRLLRLMDELLKCKVGMETAMSEGFINMAKARIHMGKERISMLQVPTTSEEDMIARYTIRRELSGEDISLVEHKFKTSLLLNSTEGEVVDDYLSKSEEAPQLRQRKSEKKRSDAETVEDNSHTASCDENQCMLLKKSDVDPMKWFGVLVPRELKLAQKSFEEAISLSVDCANLQLKIETVREALKTAKLET